jgi:hypothetical protein
MTPYQTVTVRNYGDGYVEASWGYKVTEAKKRTERGKSENKEENEERSIHRAKAQLRRKCMAAGFDHLATLTYRENITDRERAFRNFESFIRLVHSYLSDWKYIAVHEFQKRGAVHFHLGVKGYQDVTLLRTLWRLVVGDGNIDVSYKKSKKGGKWKKADLAQYLAKYIGKDMETGLNERRFRASPGIYIPEEIFYLPFKTCAEDFALHKIETLGGQVGFVWTPVESNGGYGWACSWG